MTAPAAVVLAEIRDDPLRVDEVLAVVRHPDCGAVALFLGYVRRVDHDREVAALEYSAHPTAGQTAARTAAGQAGEDGSVRIAVTHRVGRLVVGDLAVAVAVAAAHRAEAFRVCRAVVDAIKSEVPVWKHQLFADGTDEWVGLP